MEEDLIRAYYSTVSYLDALIGKLLKSLDDFGLRDNTTIIFWSDHGYHLGEQGFWCKSSNYELDVRVPLIISHPSLPVKRIDQIVELANDYLKKDIGFVAISSNDVVNYPDDDPKKMKLFAKERKFKFPYLYDESQEIAKAYDLSLIHI